MINKRRSSIGKYCTGIDGDGDGIHTRLLVQDEKGNELCSLKGKRSNVFKIGIQQAAANIADLVTEASCTIADYPAAAESVCFGLAGVSQDNVTPALHQQLVAA